MTHLHSTVIAQLVYSLGGSGFKGVNGSMVCKRHYSWNGTSGACDLWLNFQMIEVMPFLHIMCTIIEDQMKGSPSHEILATIMVTYAMSTILTGLVFLLLGMFRLGNLIQVLLGAFATLPTEYSCTSTLVLPSPHPSRLHRRDRSFLSLHRGGSNLRRPDRTRKPAILPGHLRRFCAAAVGNISSHSDLPQTPST